MKSSSVVFVAFEERENLGIRYMAALLSKAGYEVGIIDFRREREEIAEEIITLGPMVVGFSIIFEKSIYDFREFIGFLRDKGVRCHFTAGGHFASLRPGDLFEIIPAIDSIVMFEGEHTLLDLVNHIHYGRGWTGITGISYMNNGVLINNRLRPLEPDLDQFPHPMRSECKEYLLDKRYSTLLASRGCLYNCIFCDTRKFYSHPPGPVKRVRNPLKVVEEMELLHEEKNCSLFLFEDEDFPVSTQHHSGWIHEFCESLQNRGLSGKVMWKINCRPDEVDQSTFELMKQHGLFRVFLGLEDGTDDGLQQLNKQLGVADNLRGIDILKKLGIGIDYGFMLFQPATTYGSLWNNLNFLEDICGDGYMPVGYLKMKPFLETKIKKELEAAGRLKGKPGFLDYDFLDRSMNSLFHYTSDAFDAWLNAPDGLLNVTKWADIYLSVFSFYFGSTDGIQHQSGLLRDTVAEANLFMIDTLKSVSGIFESGNQRLEQNRELLNFRESIAEKHNSLLKTVARIIGKVQMYYLTKELFIH